MVGVLFVWMKSVIENGEEMKMKSNHKIRNQIALLAVGLITAATTQAALVGHWTFDETSGTNVADSAGNEYDGVVNNPVWSTNGVIGGALEMNGTDCDVEGFSSDLMATVSDEITIAFWSARDAVADQNQNGFSGYTATNARELNNHLPFGTTVYWDAGYVGNARQRIQLNDASLLGAGWHHWAFTKNAVSGEMAIYYDGAVVQTGTNLTASLVPVTQFYIGSEGGNNFYKGIMDDFRVYDNAMSATDISNLYAAVTLDYVFAAATVEPESGSIPYVAVFDGSTSVSSTNITDYAWDFGDGNSGNGMIVSNTYTVVGFYTNTLTVTDTSGNVDSVQLVVEAKPEPPIEIAYTVESYDFLIGGDFPSFSTNDLAETYSTNITGTVENPAKLFDGIITSNPPVDNDQTSDGRWTAGEYVTVEFDVSMNTLGYDITNVVSIAGWNTGSGGRSNQGYEMLVTYMDDSQEIIAPATHWAPNNPAFYWTRVSLTETNGNVMASGVKSVTINFTEDANAGGVVIGREIDILGVPTVPTDPDQPTLGYDGDSLLWNANGDFVYSVQTNLDLVYGEWATFTTVIGTPPTNTFVLPPQNENHVFYRVIVE